MPRKYRNDWIASWYHCDVTQIEYRDPNAPVATPA
jgi:hypothetical protein